MAQFHTVLDKNHHGRARPGPSAILSWRCN